MDVPLIHRMLMSCIDNRAVQDVALSCQGGRRLYVVSITVSLTLPYPAPKMKQTRHRQFPRCKYGQDLVRLISSTIPEHLYSQQTGTQVISCWRFELRVRESGGSFTPLFEVLRELICMHLL